jgi:hypothetical protein
MTDATKMEIAAKPPETKNSIKNAIKKLRGLSTNLTPRSIATGIIIKA